MANPVALVTGAGSGIGRASAIALASASFNVVLLGRKQKPLVETASLIEAAGGEAMVQPADVTDENDVAVAFAALVARYGRIDLLFNNAGTSAPKTIIGDVGLRHWNRVLAVNVTGSFLCAREAFRLMRMQTPRGGRIINNGSVSAHTPRPLGAAYTASKHAVTGLTKQISLDGRDHDIACGQIDIGNADTSTADSLARGMLQPSGQIVPEPVMPLSSVVAAVVFMATLPLDSNVQFMTVTATQMPFIGRG